LKVDLLEHMTDILKRIRERKRARLRLVVNNDLLEGMDDKNKQQSHKEEE